MGFSIWLFQRQADQTFKSLPRVRFERFLEGIASLEGGPDGLAYTVQVVVELQDRRVRGIRHVYWTKEKVLPSGYLDREHFDAIMRAAVNSTFPADMFGDKRPSGVIASEHRFEQRRYEQLATWEPSKAEVEEFNEALRKRMLGG